MTRVWGLDVPHHEQAVLLALADHADDHGGNVYPSIGYVAWKLGYSERQVHRIMADLRQRNVIVVTRAARGKFPAHYRLEFGNLPIKDPYRPRSSGPSSPASGGPDGDSCNDDILSGVESGNGLGVTPATSTPDTGDARGDISSAHADILGAHDDIAMSPKPSLVNRHIETPLEPSEKSPLARVRAREVQSKDDFRCPLCGRDGAIIQRGTGPRVCVSCARSKNSTALARASPSG